MGKEGRKERGGESGGGAEAERGGEEEKRTDLQLEQHNTAHRYLPTQSIENRIKRSVLRVNK